MKVVRLISYGRRMRYQLSVIRVRRPRVHARPLTTYYLLLTTYHLLLTTNYLLFLKIRVQPKPIPHFLQQWVFLEKIFELIARCIQHLLLFGFFQFADHQDTVVFKIRAEVANQISFEI